MKVKLHQINDKQYIGESELGYKINIDMNTDLELKKSPSPMEMLLMAIVSCAGVDITLMIKKKRKNLKHFSGGAEGTRKDTYPMKFTHIHVHYDIQSDDLTEEELAKIIDLAINKYCSVAATLNETTEITHSFTLTK